jgi:hypothetical protein
VKVTNEVAKKPPPADLPTPIWREQGRSAAVDASPRPSRFLLPLGDASFVHPAGTF